jgi:RimJ/RimL family protein N-acetyltransferase
MASARPASVPVASLRAERLSLFGFPPTQTVRELGSKKGIRQLLKLAGADSIPESPPGNSIFYCIGLSEQVWVGDVTVTFEEGSRICKLGYSVFPPYRSKGYATEAVAAVMEWIFSNSDAEAIVAETFSDWPHSIRVMEKVGLSRVNSEIGPYLVRYGITKDGSSVDLTEKRVLTLEPFCEAPLQSVLRYGKWLWTEETGLCAMATLIPLTWVCRGQPWIAVLGGCGSVWFAASMVRSFAAWWPATRTETFLQFREHGLFWANRNGTGGVTPWKTFTHLRLPRRKGIELWDGETWYWIQPQAFSGSSPDLAQAFLIEHGVELGNPPWTDF